LNPNENARSTSAKSPNLKSIKLSKTLTTLLKVGLSFGLLYLVLRKIPLSELLGLWTTLNTPYFLIGAFLFLASQVLSAKRLESFFKRSGFDLSFKSNLELYFLGMFYNFFIPGGIGGDAYKIYLLNKTFSWNVKKLSFSVLNDRISGLVALLTIGILLCLVLFPAYWPVILTALIVGLLLYFYFLKRFFPVFQNLYFKGLLYSLGIQSLQVASFLFLLVSLGPSSSYIPYALLFLISSILSLISFAGIGIREMLFLKASSIFQFDPSISVSASLLFTAVTAFFALVGIFFQLRSLNLKSNTPL